MPKLIINDESGSREHELSGGPLTCGRDSTSDITVKDEQASREHCRFEFKNGEWYVADLGSSNGTHLDGTRIKRQQLTDGAVVRIGNTTMSFVGDVQPTPPDNPEGPLEVDLSLRANGGPLDGHVFRLEKAVTTLGRSSKCDITLPENDVSAQHAELVIDGTTARIVDKDSRNGVCVNDIRVDKQIVEPGDRIRIGSTIFGLFRGDDTAAGMVNLLEESAEEDAAPPARPAVLTGRVKVVALIVALILLGGVANVLLESIPNHTVDKDNLLKGNPSFEQPSPSAGKIPGWHLSKGSFGLHRKDVQEGVAALRLAAAVGAGGDVSALCWSSPVDVSPKKVYELSALLKNSGTESAALCVAWSAPKHSWLRDLQLGERTSDARRWQRITETFKPPSWAKSARFGCAVVGQGQAKFDAFRLRGTNRPERPKRIVAGRLVFEPGPRGELTAFADGSPILGRARISATAEGRPAAQSLGTLEKGYPEIRTSMVKYVGKLGLDGRAPFSETLSSDGTDITVNYDVDVSAMRDAVIVLEWSSPKSLLTGPVALRTIRGQHSEHKTPFENQAGVNSITFFSGNKRIFLNASPPVRVTASDEPRGGVSWRLEFPLSDRAGPARVSLVWQATDAAKDALVAADLRSAIELDDAEQFGKAIKAYEAFFKRHPLYTSECAQAAARLQTVHEEIASRVKTAAGLAKRALTSKSDGDFVAAMRTCEALVKRLEGHAEAERVTRMLTDLKTQHHAAVQERKAKEAAGLVEKARGYVAKKEFTTARFTCKYVIRKFPGTPSAAAARAILDKLPPSE